MASLEGITPANSLPVRSNSSALEAQNTLIFCRVLILGVASTGCVGPKDA